MDIEKLCYSDTAIEKGWNNKPSCLHVYMNLQQLCSVLDSLEKILGVDIIVNSGYRSPHLNEIVGGVLGSWHTLGLAADIRVENTARCTLTDLKNLCKELRKTRLSEVVEYDNYVHIAIKPYN